MISIFKSRKNIQCEWKKKTIEYARSVNAYVENGKNKGWENAGKEPKDNGRDKLVPRFLDALRAANLDGEVEGFRKDWPLAHSPFYSILGENGQSIPEISLLEDGTIVARIGSCYEDGYVVEIRNSAIRKLDDVSYFGKSYDKKYFAFTSIDGITVTEGWMGKAVGNFRYPRKNEGVPREFNLPEGDEISDPTKIIPFPKGDKVLFISSEGIFVLSNTGSTRLLPTEEQISDHFNWLQEECPEDELSLGLSMEHGSVSPCGKYIAVGSQDGSHLVFDEELNLAADIGNMSEYPHYALFSHDGDMVAVNSCHFYNGMTIGVETKHFPEFKTEPYDEHEKVQILEDGSRVYAGVSRDDEFIVGNAGGYVIAFGKDGKEHWQHFIGSSIGDMDISADGKSLICSTHAGYLSVIELDNVEREPYEIGTGNNSEVRRWVFWKNEAEPLQW